MADVDLHRDLLTAYKSSPNSNIDPAILQRLAKKLQLLTISDLKQESLALHEMTYDRESIEQWLEGHDTRPKTQQKLSNKSLTPNYVLHSHSTMVLGQWYRSPRHPAQLNQTKPDCSSPQHAKVIELVCKLSSRSIEDKRSTTVELHLLARLSAENRTVELRLLARLSAENHCCIAEAGAIPFLANLFSTLDVHTQENAVTAVLNLSILEENKENIVATGAVPAILKCAEEG
ncbi:protein spotted leaf 11-like [Zingiber officinale]|uniref:protein spotted leaf 11-like n=1 Tax=Zingiber officinale TaxID=94328 RepID=UPI001C4B7BC4|nr:protein spotted leaf 11-like [Zingiber officinale]